MREIPRVVKGGQQPATLLEIKDLSKTFGRHTVLTKAAMRVEPGEVRALIGANGSGKSTFVKCLTGAQPGDSGSMITIEGRRVSRDFGPKTAYASGIRVVHQEAPLIDDLSIADNFAIYHGFPTSFGILVKDRRSARSASEALERFGVGIDPRTLAGDLGAAERAMVAIAIAISDETGPAKLLVLDEPTASIPAGDSERFLDAVHRASSDLGVILVTHRLQEVLEHCTHVTAFRDGHTVLDAAIGECDRPRLVDAIVGRGHSAGVHEADASALPARFAPVVDRDNSEPALRLAGVSGQILRDLDLEVGSGEIVGVSGIVGSGASEIGPILAGTQHRTGGDVIVGGQLLPKHVSSVRSQKAGIGYVPADRLHEGGLHDFSVLDNVALPALAEYATNRSRLRKDVELVIRTLDVRPADANKQFGLLSGGNQQKVIVGKWALRRPKVLVLDDPMAGVDLGARDKIGELVRGLREAGTAVLVISPEAGPLVALCDRVVALRDGRIADHLEGAAVTEKAISLATL